MAVEILTPDLWEDGFEGEIRYWAGSPFVFSNGEWSATLVDVNIEYKKTMLEVLKSCWMYLLGAFILGILTKKYFLKKW